jgi:hypothetical protein
MMLPTPTANCELLDVKVWLLLFLFINKSEWSFEKLSDIVTCMNGIGFQKRQTHLVLYS